MSVLGTVIFCNSCGESSPEVQREFFIGSCGHVFCSLCMANYKNFCRICNCQCKILQINEQMPSEVKIFFEDKSISNQFQLIEKINTFQEKHVRLYVEKTQIYQQKYNKIKTEVMQLNKMKQEINETIKREQANMDKLRNAYRYVYNFTIDQQISYIFFFFQIWKNHTKSVYIGFVIIFFSHITRTITGLIKRKPITRYHYAACG